MIRVWKWKKLLPSSVTVFSLKIWSGKFSYSSWINSRLRKYTFSINGFTDQENQRLNLALDRLRLFGEAGQRNCLHLLVDAEYTYMNNGISAFALAMMVAFNQVIIQLENLVKNWGECLGEASCMEYISMLLKTSSEHNIIRNGSCQVTWQMFWS